MFLNDRGVIKYPARKQQINDFNGLILGNITPTDVDGIIEYKNKAYIIIEIKYKDAELPNGQRIALERMAIDLIKSGKKAIVLIAEHNVDDTSKSVDVSSCYIRKYFLMNKWCLPKSPIKVKEAIDIFLKGR